MQSKSFFALLAAVVVAVVAAAWVDRGNQPTTESDVHNAPLLPGLRDEINAIDTVGLTGAGGQAIATLRRGSDGWHVVEKSGYPADTAKLRELLFRLADANVIEAKTANPARYAELGVEDVAAAKCDAAPPAADAADRASAQKKCLDAKGVLLTLGGLRTPLKLIVGQYNGGGGGGTFVRRDGEARSLLASGNLSIDKSVSSWIRHDLIDIDSARIKQVALTGLDGKTLRVYKEQSADNSFKVADVPAGRELASDFVANSLGSGLSNLRADDVFSAKDAPAAEKKSFKVRYLAFGGLVVDVTAWEADGKNQIQLAASNDAAQLDAYIAAEQGKAKGAYESAVAAAKLKAVEAKADDAAIAKAADAVAKPAALVDAAKDRAERVAAAAKVVEDLNKSFAGWTFSVPAYEFANFNKSMEELLKPLQSKPVPGITPVPDGKTRAAGPAKP